MKNKNGFTLVEILAVLVILGILMVIAIPSINNTLKTSRVKTMQLEIDKIKKDLGGYFAMLPYDINDITKQEDRVYLWDIKDLPTETDGYRGVLVGSPVKNAKLGVLEVGYVLFVTNGKYASFTEISFNYASKEESIIGPYNTIMRENVSNKQADWSAYDSKKAYFEFAGSPDYIYDGVTGKKLKLTYAEKKDS